VLALVRDLRDRGTAVLYVTHRLAELPDLADVVTVLRDGRRAATARIAEVTQGELIRQMVGREVAERSAGRARTPGREVLVLAQVANRAAGLAGIDLALHAGEITGLAGLVGAGRTELAECLFGLRPLDGGSLRLCGEPFAPRSPADAIAAGVVLVPEDRRRHGVIPEFTVTENLTLPHLREFTRHGLLDRSAEATAARDAVAAFSVRTAGPDAAVATLSGGNQQKVALARWLRRRPRVLILDEPTQGVDVAARAEVHDRIRAAADAGIAVLVISSDLPELFALADRIAVLRGGRLAGVLPAAGTDPEQVMALCVHGER
jgi:ABC-type sugar transport system ATPase subunit